MSGRISVVGLGPGDASHRTAAAEEALREASHLVGYGPYLARITVRDDQTVHASDNREELDRAHHALALAAAGETVALVSSGDAGVFAMASTLFEALEADGGPDVEIAVVPGVTAMIAAAAKTGAPLGHDFCAISLSDNLKPWETVLRRVRAAAEADFVIALYNPISRARPWQLGKVLELLRGLRAAETPGRLRDGGDPAGRDHRGDAARRRPGGDGGHADGGDRRLERHPQRAPRRRRCLGLYAAQGGGPGMTRHQPPPGLLDRRHGRPRRRRSVHHDDGYSEIPRGDELGDGRRPAGVLGDHRIDPVVPEQPRLVFRREGAARGDRRRPDGRSSGAGGSTLRIK